MTVPVKDIIIKLKSSGLSYREIARHLDISHVTVLRWVRGIHKPRDPDKIAVKLANLVIENDRILVNDYYSDTHNGPPQHFFGLQGGEDLHIERFKRTIKKVADLLDTFNRKWIETATLIGLEYFNNGGSKRLYSRKLMSFVLACYRVAMYKIHYVYPDWDEKFEFFKLMNIFDEEEYLRFFLNLSMQHLK